AVESEEGKGSIFSVEFEEVTVPALRAASASVAEVSRDVDSVHFDDATVLLADDIESNRILMRELFKTFSISSIEAENGQQAVDFAREYKPDLILMDIRMPVMDGFEATRIIKENDELNGVPIVMFTASAMKEQELELRKADFDGFLTKPVRKNELISELMRFLPYQLDAEELLDEEPSTRDPKEIILGKEALEKLPELIALLEGDISETWKRISTIFVVREIKTFAGEIIRLGSHFKVKALSNWGNKLFKEIENYDMDKAPVTLEYFPQ
ncbi:MAG: response regulator, partial [bacterium]|nr:response regulator [bacterium]